MPLRRQPRVPASGCGVMVGFRCTADTHHRQPGAAVRKTPNRNCPPTPCAATTFVMSVCSVLGVAVVDCAVTAWGPWSECDADCGTGMMRRSRSVQRQPENGGKHCPSLLQKRGCQGTRCPHSNKSALKETAMLLPAKLGNSRRANETTDIRRNLRLRYPKQPHENNEYCVQFEVLKASKACRKETSYSSLREGERVCVRCESQALRPALGYRCAGPGVADRGTRWTALSAPHCHGKWLRLSHHDDQPSCPACANGASFIFV
ncbi:somatomedin-B and thrombospondin type-1 domain-containing protein-like [Schistocerca serialis cubense]|uniref:somatomedin-B and thrombospondin type-1 domain-containing protein-like n=2 Tax=Schistocerca TaxID=7008 RepID=UPI00214E9A84|nr:somatomedin-B and thrombospondin type-1 domain-containing protein-like [Schistocerca serialis cubense]